MSDELKVFERFVASGFDRKKFTHAIYKKLTFAFGFIAHYDIDGFYVERFATPDQRVATFACVTNRTAHTPFEVSLQDYVRRERLLESAQQMAAAELEASERAELARLKAKYEPADDVTLATRVLMKSGVRGSVVAIGLHGAIQVKNELEGGAYCYWFNREDVSQVLPAEEVDPLS
jgi:hypothetical protein